MKTINVPLEDSEHKQLVEAKGKLSWREFLLDMLKSYPKKDEGGQK